MTARQVFAIYDVLVLALFGGMLAMLFSGCPRLPSLREGYHLDAPSVALAEDILRSHWTTMDAGGMPAVWSAVQAGEVLAEVAGEVLAGTL